MASRPDGERASPRIRTTVGGVVVLLLVAAAAAVLSFALNAPGGSRIVAPTAGPLDPTAAGEAVPGPLGEPLLVHVLGAVRAPGLYELTDGDRLIDAVAAAGGFANEADRGALNLARVLGDGEQVYVPAVGEDPPEPHDDGGTLVNVNTADAAELETLPGVGPALASRILAWREQNGRFASVDDLLNVPGIGAKTLSALAELVTT